MTEEEYRQAMGTPVQLPPPYGGQTLGQIIRQGSDSNFMQQLARTRRNIRQYFSPSGQYGMPGRRPPGRGEGGGRNRNI